MRIIRRSTDGRYEYWAGGYWSPSRDSAYVYSEGDSFTIFNQMKRDGIFARRIEVDKRKRSKIDERMIT